MPELVVTLYSSSFCGACTRTRQALDRVAPLLGERIAVRHVNVAQAPEEGEARGIAVTPTVVIDAPDGTELRRASGVPTTEQLLAAIAAALPA